MLKTPRVYEINVDAEYEAMLKQYPRFNSIRAGHIIYSDNLKSKWMEQHEWIKLAKYHYYNIVNSISYFENAISINDSIKKFEPGLEKSKFEMASYYVGLTQLKKDLKEEKKNIAKAMVFQSLIKLEMETRKGK